MNNTIQLSDGDMKCWDDKSILSDNQLEITTDSFHYLKKYPRWLTIESSIEILFENQNQTLLT